MSALAWKRVLQFDALVILLFWTIGLVELLSGPSGTEGANYGGAIEQEADAAFDSFRFWAFTMNSVPILIFGVALLFFSRKKGWI